MFRFFTLFALILFSYQAPVAAISNIESQRPTPPKEGFSGGLEFTANGKNGNVQEDRYGAGARLIYTHEQETFFALFSKTRSRTQDIETADQAFAHLRWIHQQNDRFATEGFVQWQEDEFSNLLSRYLAGGGGRYKWLDYPEHYSLTSGIGLFREWERTDLGSFAEDKSVWRSNFYTVYKQQLNPQVNWYGTAYFQPRLGEAGDYRILFEAGFGVRLTDAFELKLFYSLLHDSQPPQNLQVDPPIDLQETNSQYSTSVVYEF